jgi:hypothetical protein
VSFNVLTIRTGGETGNEALFPVLSDPSQPQIIAPDRYDGPNIVRVVATAVRVAAAGEQVKTLVQLRDVKIDVYVTDGRLAIACEKYDKGGGWVGFGGAGAMVAITANAVSKMRAASRSRGKVLVGHVRYPWVKTVGASSKSGMLSSEAIRLEFCEKLPGGTARKMIELTLPKNIDATLLAQDITRRVAAYRLAHYPDIGQEERVKFAGLSQAPPRLEPLPRKFALCHMPTFYFVSAGSAFPHSSTAPAGGQPPDAGPAPSRAAGPGHTFCPRCGTQGTTGDHFCGACGTAMTSRTGS